MGWVGYANGSSDGNMMGIRSGRLFGLLNCWGQARLDGSGFAKEGFKDVAGVGSGEVIVSVTSSGVDVIQVPLLIGLLSAPDCALSKLCRGRLGTCVAFGRGIICVGNVLDRWGKVCLIGVLTGSGSADTLDGAGRFRLTGAFELWRFFNISGNDLNRH